MKEGIAWSVYSGVAAAQLAGAGFTGYPDSFEQGILYDTRKLLGSGHQLGAIDGLFFKPYACCRWIHSAIDAALALMKEHGFTAGGIDRVRIRTFGHAVNLGNNPLPTSSAEAQFSIPFCVAAAFIHGGDSLLPMSSALLMDREVLSFARKIEVEFDPAMQELFPAKAPAVVTVSIDGREHSARVDDAFGDPANPMLRSDLQSKFMNVTDGVLSAEAQEMVSMMLETPEFSVAELIDAITLGTAAANC